MREEILHLGYLNLRLSREQSRKEEGDQDIKIRIHSLHINGEISLEEEKPTTQTYNNHGILNTPPAPKVEKTSTPAIEKKKPLGPKDDIL